ncbi:hypothetical protein HU718_014915 [Pseudomonas tensinigenes]|uniref:Ig-like domain repeat protein n=1 Tax=Pseudomonas tensinigenes TaxID=2745511 RepID=A0ABX8PPU9_9PSED|nr:hypothetical protein [Pseudomonas tensinigenes]QXI03338.1 hypothetical protein HU718_014915 [Pseudomonas tensinigenes]
MSTPDQPLALTELNIPGRSKDPVSQDPDIWGINIAAALGNFPLNGLLCQAGPWGNMAEGDRLTIFWGTGQNVWVETVDATEVNTQLRMFVPSRHMVDGRFAVSYVVKPLGGMDQASEVMQVLVKLTRPGGDDDNDDGGHSKLIMTIPKEIVDGGIDKDNVAAGVPISIGKADGTPPYPFAAAGDVCRLSWGGIYVFSAALTQEQAEGKAPIIISITEAIIREAGDAETSGVAVVFEVYDCVFNRSEDWSAEQRIVVAVDATRLGAPLLKETLNNVLDVDKLGDADGTVQIIATDTSKFTVGDIPYIRIKGTPVEGPPIDLEVEGAALTSVPSVTDDKVPNAVLRQLAKSQITLSYRLEKADASPDLRSKGQFIRAIGEVQRLAAPKMLDENSGALDPALPQVRVEIPFDKSFAEGQVLKIFMLGTTPGLKPYLPDLPTRLITRNDIVAAQPLLYNIDGKHLAPVNGGKAEFYYQQLIAETVLATLDTYEATRAIRESIHTEILQVGEARLELPQPEVAGVVNGVLPADTAGTTLTVVYTETVKGDEVFMFWHGSITGEYTDSIKLSEFTAGQPVPFPIGAELIKGNEGGSVIARYEIKRAAGGTSYAEPLKFDVGVALDLTAPDIKEAPNGTSLDPFAGKDTLTAVVDYVGMLLDDEIIVTFSGAPGTPEGGSHITAPWTVRTLGAQDIPLDNTVIAFNLGQSVTVSYTVARGSDDPKDSKTRTLAVLPIKNEDNRLPDPVINGITSAELDVTTLPGQPRTRIAAWLLLALKQTLWLRYFVEGNPTPISTTYNGALIPPDGVPGGMQPYTPMAELNKLADGAKLRIEFKVGFDGSTDESKAVVFPSRVYTVKAVKDVKPEITSVKDSKGAEIVHDGGTVDPVVTLTGTAAPDQEVEIFEGATPKGKRPVDGTGIWTYTATLTAIGTRTFKVKADYGSGQESVGRTFTYSSVLTPVITSVQDSKGAEIPNNTITLDPNIKLTGTATSRLHVEIFDGATSKGTAQVSGFTGKWELEVKGLSLTVHNFTAKALYGTEPVSAVRTLTVTAVIVPTLDKVLDDTGADIPNDYTTESTTLKLQGTASKGQQVDIFEGSEPSAEFKGTATADAAGSWEHPIIVPLGARRLYAQSRYHIGTVHSNIRTLNVVPKDLYVDNFGPNTEYRDGETRHFEKINVTRVNISGTSNMWARDLLNSSPNVGEVKMVIGFKGRTFKLLKFHCLCWSPRLNQGPPVITGVLVRIDFFNGTELVHQYNINGDGGLWREITIKLLGGLSFDSVEIRLFPAKNLHFSSILINWIFCTNDV